MKTLLIPVDFSETSHKALEVAATIAKRVNAKIVLTHMAGVEDGIGKKPNNFEEALYYSKVTGKKFEEFTKVPYLEGIVVEPVLQKHLDFSSITDMASEIDANLIVMGSSGSQGLSEFLVGSNAEKVVRNSETPVLIIKDNELNFAPESILYASDFNEESISAYNRIIEVATMLGTRIEFLYVNTSGGGFKSTKEVDEILLNFFQAVKHSNPVKAIKTVNRYSDYSVEQGIMNFASLIGSDIIAVPTHGRKGLAHFFQGSISEDIANHASKPVLTVKM